MRDGYNASSGSSSSQGEEGAARPRHRKTLTIYERGMMNTGNKISGAQEDGFTAMIEAKTAQIPSSAYLAAALASMATSAIFKASGKDHAALFVGQWAAPFLLLGVYNKMVKQHGSDAESQQKAPKVKAATVTA
jgi:hypothetical protein